MSNDSELRQKAREAIDGGELPNRPPDRMWGGPATGARCAICGEPTTECEFEFAYEGDDSRSHFAHSRCWRAFEAEVDALAGLNGFGPASMAEPQADDLLRANGG